MPRNHRASFAMLVISTVALSACYNMATPSYHPGDARDLVASVARQGVTVRSATPGDSACDDPSLIANAMHLAVTDPDGGADRDVWVYSFRERSWDASQAPVDACEAAFTTAHPGVTVTRLDVPVYRAFGADWSERLTQAMSSSLADAAEAGQP